MRYFLILAIALMFTSCHPRYLQVRTEYLTRRYLSSEQIDTPDPFRHCFVGQQLVIHWQLPQSCLQQNLLLVVHMRYGNKCIETISKKITHPNNYFTYRLVNNDYWEKEGILSYKIELYENENLLDCCMHHIWTDIISIADDDHNALE